MGWRLQGPCCSLHLARTADICDSWGRLPRDGGPSACPPRQPPEPGRRRSWSLSWRSWRGWQPLLGQREVQGASLSGEASSCRSPGCSHSCWPTGPAGHTGWAVRPGSAPRGCGQFPRPAPPPRPRKPQNGRLCPEGRPQMLPRLRLCADRAAERGPPTWSGWRAAVLCPQPSPAALPPRPETSPVLLEHCLTLLLLHPCVLRPAPDPRAAPQVSSPLPSRPANILRGRWGRGTLLSPQSREWTRASSPRSGSERGGPHEAVSHTRAQHRCPARQLSLRTPTARPGPRHHRVPQEGFGPG